MEMLKRLVKEEEGQGIVEYVLIIAVISIVAIAYGNNITAAVETLFKKIGTALSTGTL